MKIPTKRRLPNWEYELLKLGVPLASIPQLPDNPTHSDKTKRAFALKALWERKTGRKAPRSTPENYNLSADQRKAHRLQVQATTGVSVLDQIARERNERKLLKRKQRSYEEQINEDIQQGSPWTNIDTRVVDEEAGRLDRVSPTVPAGHRWVTDEKLTPAKVSARESSVTRRLRPQGAQLFIPVCSAVDYGASGTTYAAAAGPARPVMEVRS